MENVNDEDGKLMDLVKSIRKAASFKRGSPIREMTGKLRMATIEPLRRQAAALRRRWSKKTFVAITGSSGKTSTNMILRHILNGSGVACGPDRGLNGIGDIRRALLKYPRNATHIVIEVGAGESMALRKSSAMLKPDLSIITMVRLEHYSVFRTLERVAEEKGWLAENTMPNGTVLVNGDDPFALQAARRTKARIVTFGQQDGLDYRVSDIHAAYPELLSFKVSWKDGSQKIVTPFIADYSWLPVTAAFAAAIELGVPAHEAATRIATCPQVDYRMSTVVIEGGPTFILDTAKAPWHSIFMAIDTMARAQAPRKRIIFGMISDYAGNSSSKYRKVFEAAKSAVDEVIFINDKTHRSGATPEEIASGKYSGFTSAKALYDHLRTTTVPGELILLKGSASDHLERLALAFETDVQCWRDRCGEKKACRICGLFALPFEDHQAILRARKRENRKFSFAKVLGK
jgi:UDP-N-acetylmuramoyl-tripeptide--D-alanyl-D-alanine ligase